MLVMLFVDWECVGCYCRVIDCRVLLGLIYRPDIKVNVALVPSTKSHWILTSCRKQNLRQTKVYDTGFVQPDNLHKERHL